MLSQGPVLHNSLFLGKKCYTLYIATKNFLEEMDRIKLVKFLCDPTALPFFFVGTMSNRHWELSFLHLYILNKSSIFFYLLYVLISDQLIIYMDHWHLPCNPLPPPPPHLTGIKCRNRLGLYFRSIRLWQSVRGGAAGYRGGEGRLAGLAGQADSY